MNRSIKFRALAPVWMVAALAVWSVASCGGGGVVGSGGTGRAAGVTVGTVNGFGSVIVDSAPYDVRNAPVVSENAPGLESPAEVKLGHRVAVGYDTAGVANVVRVDAALAGTVASVVSASRFTLLGQTVRVNATATAGPITQFGGGYTQGADVHAGDLVEVHGVLVTQAGSTLIQATRIDKLAAAPPYLRVTGLVSSLSPGSPATFALGGLSVDASHSTVLPAGTALANGQAVTVLALPGADASGVQAAQIRIRTLSAGEIDDVVSGSISGLDTQARTFTLGSLRVSYSTATPSPATSALANAQYVQVRGRVGTDGVLAAASVTIRDASANTESELRGNITGNGPLTGRFTVRGTAVDASHASLRSCPAGGLSNGLFVEVHGTLGSTGVVAQTVQCEDEPPDATIEREGMAGAVDAAAMSFSLTPSQGAAITVKWTSATYFGGATPEALAGRIVHAEGTLAGAVLVASKIEIEH
ncbi:MAG: DUF5666 domain-containing protein [Pseudomonadota bacterium]